MTKTKGGLEIGNPMSVITAIPLPLIFCILNFSKLIEPEDLDYWDYCLRKLFVQKATALDKCIGYTWHTLLSFPLLIILPAYLGPGAKNTLPNWPIRTFLQRKGWIYKKTPRGLELHEWAALGAGSACFKGMVFQTWGTTYSFEL